MSPEAIIIDLKLIPLELTIFNIISYMVCNLPNMVYTWSVNFLWGASEGLLPHMEYTDHVYTILGEVDNYKP